jgi:hypothetical protein
MMMAHRFNYLHSGHYPSFCSFIQNSLLETGLCLHPYIKKPIQLGTIDTASPYFQK